MPGDPSFSGGIGGLGGGGGGGGGVGFGFGVLGGGFRWEDLRAVAPLIPEAPTFSVLAVGYSIPPPLPAFEPYTIFEESAVCCPLPDVNGTEFPGTVG